MTLIFTQGLRVRGKLELVQSSSCIVATELFMMVDYVRKMTVKTSCEYGEYESFEHLLFFMCVHACLCVCVCVCVCTHACVCVCVCVCV